MQVTFPHLLLSQLSELLEMKMGLYYPEKRWDDLERRIASAAQELGVRDTESGILQLLSRSLTRGQIEILARHLTVGETYFFREQRGLDVLEGRIFPELMRMCKRGNRKLRIWSAGCCTGEEPYTIAMLLDRLFQHDGEWNATILATDINPAFLDKAAEGLYSEWSFRATPDWIKERYFKRKKNGLFEILPHIRKRVTFSYLNLAEDVYPSVASNRNAMDIIFCRNVLMYFSPEGVRRIGQNFHRSLVSNGWLVVSPVEMSDDFFPQFKSTAFPGAFLYQKVESPESRRNMVEYRFSGALPNISRRVQKPLTHTFGVQGLFTTSTLKRSAAAELPVVTDLVEQPLTAHPVTDQPEREEFEVLCQSARFHANRGDLTKAARRCEEAIAANKLEPAAYYLLATIQQELGQVEDAMQSLMRTLYLDPDLVLAHFALGNLCLSHGKSREAERHLDNALLLLASYPSHAILPESEGLIAGRLTEVITSMRTSKFAGLPGNKEQSIDN